MSDSASVVSQLGDLAERAGIRRVHVLAWRDLDDPEAGGSELHAHEILRLWASAGIDINMRTSYSPGQAQVVWRDGYRAIRKAGRYMVFPRAAFSEAAGWHGHRDALVEIWNGMPFLSPLWSSGPRVAWMHHLHDTMWEMTLPPRLAKIGRAIKFDIAPPLYRLRRTPIVTLSESSKAQLVSRLGFKASSVHVVPVGISQAYAPGTEKSPTPLVVACGRLVAVKQFPKVVDALIAVRQRVPNVEAVLMGDGYDRAAIQAQVDAAGATDWIRLVGFVTDEEKIDYYQRAWVLASASAHEGWGMTLTEAAACGTPAVASNIAGHRDALSDDVSGILFDDHEAFVGALVALLTDAALLARLTTGALEWSKRFTWGRTALGTFEVLCQQAQRRAAR